MDGAADDAANVAAIKGEGSQSFTASKISASFTFAYDADTKEFTYSMTIGGKAFGDITRTGAQRPCGIALSLERTPQQGRSGAVQPDACLI